MPSHIFEVIKPTKFKKKISEELEFWDHSRRKRKSYNHQTEHYLSF